MARNLTLLRFKSIAQHYAHGLIANQRMTNALNRSRDTGSRSAVTLPYRPCEEGASPSGPLVETRGWWRLTPQ